MNAMCLSSSKVDGADSGNTTSFILVPFKQTQNSDKFINVKKPLVYGLAKF